MVYKYRITLSGIKGFYRVYLVSGANSLYTFHKQIRTDLEFPQDQQILFKALASDGSVLARYPLVDIGYGAADSVSIAQTVKAGVQSFVYFYDIQARKSVNITLEEEIKEPTDEDDKTPSVTVPTLVEVKGPVPLAFENGYVAFEDMPDRKLPSDLGDDDEDDDDDDDDEEEEDDDDEEGKEIYDENE